MKVFLIVAAGTVGGVLLVYMAYFLGAVLAAPLIMWAWNGSLAALYPSIFPLISYGHGFWLSILSSLLLKSVQTNNQTKDK